MMLSLQLLATMSAGRQRVVKEVTEIGKPLMKKLMVMPLTINLEIIFNPIRLAEDINFMLET